MASTTASTFALHGAISAARPVPHTARPRRITPQAGRALEILSHAIEYLADEYAHHGGNLNANDNQVQAMQLLMGLNRSVYFDCPEIPSIRERCSVLFNRLLSRSAS